MKPISKNKIKQYKSLKLKKFRDQYKLFIAEGQKIVSDLIKYHAKNIECVIADETWIMENPEISENIDTYNARSNEFKTISNLTTVTNVMAIVKIPKHTLDINHLSDQLVIALDEIQDPGNLGTILRIANWFGVKHIICSETTVDCYNPKVVQASMGTLMNVRIYYCNLPEVLTEIKNKNIAPVYGTSLDGENIYSQKLPQHAVLLFGNESKGLSPLIKNIITHKLIIPYISDDLPVTDSLNVSVAAAICCSEFRRKAWL